MDIHAKLVALIVYYLKNRKVLPVCFAVVIFVIFVQTERGKTMLTNEREKRICERYGEWDDDGFVHCFECPLRKGDGRYELMCKATTHYNRHTKKWEYDDEEVERREE